MEVPVGYTCTTNKVRQFSLTPTKLWVNCQVRPVGLYQNIIYGVWHLVSFLKVVMHFTQM